MSRAVVLWFQFWNWILNLGKIKPVVLDGTESATKIKEQFFSAQRDMLDHAVLAEYHGAMQEMLYYRRKRLHEDPFMKKYFEPEPEEHELPLAVILPPKPKVH